MIRLFINTDFSQNKIIELNDKQHHYLRNVMRLNNQDEIAVFNGTQGQWRAFINANHKKQTTLTLDVCTTEQTSLKKCILCPCIIKKENMDLVLQKATELNATDIIPIISSRTVVRNFNQDRANLIVTESAEQCERLSLPKIHTPINLSDIFTHLPNDITLIYLAERLENTPQINKNITPAFLIGPEGGFTPQEISFLSTQKNTHPLHFNNTILRAETASIAVLSCWQFDF